MEHEIRSAEESRQKIIKIYKAKVHGRSPDTSESNQGHDGRKGHWLERQMGSRIDADNNPDIFGYELKNYTGMKTSFGDWGPDYFIFRDEKRFPNLIGKKGKDRSKQHNINKNIFLRAFGVWRDDTEEYGYGKWEGGGYYSWSGKPSPTRATEGFNSFGQALVVNEDDSISIVYSFSKDTRDNKEEIVPKEFQIDGLVLFRWSRDWIRDKVENKFSRFGWCKCNMKDGKYNEIVFGEKIDLKKFLGWVRSGDIFFDTRMKQRRPDGSDRYGMQWRANNKFWKSLVTYRYPN